MMAQIMGPGRGCRCVGGVAATMEAPGGLMALTGGPSSLPPVKPQPVIQFGEQMPRYAWYLSEAVIKLSSDRQRGPGHQPLAELGEEILEEHLPPDEQVGSPCVACGGPWPCRMFLSITAAS